MGESSNAGKLHADSQLEDVSLESKLFGACQEPLKGCSCGNTECSILCPCTRFTFNGKHEESNEPLCTCTHLMSTHESEALLKRDRRQLSIRGASCKKPRKSKRPTAKQYADRLRSAEHLAYSMSQVECVCKTRAPGSVGCKVGFSPG